MQNDIYQTFQDESTFYRLVGSLKTDFRYVIHLKHVPGAVAVKKEELADIKEYQYPRERSLFRAVKPCRKILDSYKFDGDLLQSFHMTESDGSFLFRKQFDVTAKRILCHSEKDALSDFLDFLEKHNRCFLMSIDEETIAILQSKLQRYFPDRLQTLKIKGFTYWKRSLRKLGIPHIELEDTSSSTFCDALAIAKVLSTRFHRVLLFLLQKDFFSFSVRITVRCSLKL